MISKVSPTKRPTLTRRRFQSEDWDTRCPDQISTPSLGGKPPPAKRRDPDILSSTANTVAKKPRTIVLKEHSDADRIARVNALVVNNIATAGYFIEIFPEECNVQDRWFMEVTTSKIVNGKLRGIWCKANSLTAESKTVQSCALGHVKDYGDRSTFIDV